MSIAGLIVTPPALFFLRKVIRRVRGIARMQFTGGTRIIETMQEALQGMRTVKAFSLEDEMRRRLAVSVAAVEHEANKMARVGNRASPMMETLGGIAIALAVIYGGYRIIETGATPGEFVSFHRRVPARPTSRPSGWRGSTSISTTISSASACSTRSSTARRASRATMTGRRSSLTTARLEFADVRFAYRPGTPVLRGMSFVAQPGKVTALVGPSGGGKSTVLNLILRLYDADSGRILIDGQDIAAVSRALAAAADRLCRPDRSAVPRQRSATTSASAGSAPARRKSSPRPRPRMRTTSSSAFPPVTTRRSANTACSFPAVSASASPSLAR